MKNVNLLSSTLAVGVLAVLIWGRTAAAFPGEHGYGGGMVTSEQQAAAQAISVQHEQAVMPLYLQLNAKKAELDALYYTRNPDSNRVKVLYNEIAGMEAKLFSLNAEYRSKLGVQGGSFTGYRGNCGDYHGYGRHGGGRYRGGPAGGMPYNGYSRGSCYGGGRSGW